VFCAGAVVGAKQTSKGLVFCKVLSKGVKLGMKFNKQGFGLVWVLCKDKVRVPS